MRGVLHGECTITQIMKCRNSCFWRFPAGKLGTHAPQSLTRTQFGGSSESGFTGFYDWTGLGDLHRGTVPILIGVTQLSSMTTVIPAKAGIQWRNR